MDTSTQTASVQPVFTASDVEKLAALSRLGLTDAEKEQFAKEIGGILAYVGKIQEVAAGSHSEADIAAHRTDSANYAQKNIMREDIADKDHGNELNPNPSILVEAAPEHTTDYIKVKKILGGSQ